MVIQSLHYFPCLEWFSCLMGNEDVVVDVHEYYLKQTYRNRTCILSANGKLALTIPVKAPNHTPICDVKIENDFPWQHQHWQAIMSAYNSAPYFLYYQDYFKPLYEKRFELLVDWNKAILEVCLKLMKADVNINYSEQYCAPQTSDTDTRLLISPKQKHSFNSKPYLQVFTEKFPFEPNLGILDVLFNHGPRWKEFI